MCWSARDASMSKARRSVVSSVCKSLMLSRSASCGVYSLPSFALLPGRVWICAECAAQRDNASGRAAAQKYERQARAP